MYTPLTTLQFSINFIFNAILVSINDFNVYVLKVNVLLFANTGNSELAYCRLTFNKTHTQSTYTKLHTCFDHYYTQPHHIAIVLTCVVAVSGWVTGRLD